MAFQSVPHGVEARIIASIGEQPCVNVINIDVGHEVTSADLNGVAIVVDAWMNDAMLSHLSDEYSYIHTIARDLEHADSSEALVGAIPPVPGGTAEPSLPSQVACVQSFRTAFIGRSFRGRFYMGGLTANQLIDPQTLDTTYVTQLNGAMIDLVDALHTAGYALCVLSRIAGGVARVAGLLTEIIAIVTNTKVDTQRRRSAN